MILFSGCAAFFFRRIQNADYHQYKTGKANDRCQFYTPGAEDIGFKSAFECGGRPVISRKPAMIRRMAMPQMIRFVLLNAILF
jgi:hypothetical protein